MIQPLFSYFPGYFSQGNTTTFAKAVTAAAPNPSVLFQFSSVNQFKDPSRDTSEPMEAEWEVEMMETDGPVRAASGLQPWYQQQQLEQLQCAFDMMHVA